MLRSQGRVTICIYCPFWRPTNFAPYADVLFCFVLFFIRPICYLRPSFLSLLVVTQIRGHLPGSPPPASLRFVLLHLHISREGLTPSLVDSRLAGLRLTTLGALSHWSSFFVQIHSKSRPTVGFELQGQRITGVHNNQDQIWFVKIGNIYRFLCWSQVLIIMVPRKLAAFEGGHVALESTSYRLAPFLKWCPLFLLSLSEISTTSNRSWSTIYGHLDLNPPLCVVQDLHTLNTTYPTQERCAG